MIQDVNIVPENYLKVIKNQPIHMLLAHLLLDDKYKKYQNYYKKLGKQGKYLILDNSAYEKEKALPFNKILPLIKKYNISEVILPDVLKNSDKTIKRSLEAFKTLKKQQINVKTMFVVQGQDVDECLYSLYTFLELGGLPDVIGIPKIIAENYRDARIEFLQRLNEICPIKKIPFQIHLLGCKDDVLEIKCIDKKIKLGRLPKIRSVDSSIAYVFAREGMNLNDGIRPLKKIDFKDNKNSCNIKLLKENINFFHHEINGEYLKCYNKVIEVNF